jgi:hypothetical protein
MRLFLAALKASLNLLKFMSLDVFNFHIAAEENAYANICLSARNAKSSKCEADIIIYI